MARVLIGLALYNGAEHVAAQLDSIAAQDHPNWRLVAGGAIAVFILATSITGVTTLARAGDVARASGDPALREERK